MSRIDSIRFTKERLIDLAVQAARLKRLGVYWDATDQCDIRPSNSSVEGLLRIFRENLENSADDLLCLLTQPEAIQTDDPPSEDVAVPV